MGFLSGLFGASDADKQRKLQQKQIDATYKFNKKDYKFGQRQAQQSYKFAKEGLKINRQNEKALFNFNYQTQLEGARWQQALQDYQYQSQLKQYGKSEQIYAQQIGFNQEAGKRQLGINELVYNRQKGLNQQAANNAFESENRRLYDIITEQAYAKQEQFTALMQAEGEQLARGVSGKSVQKGMQGIIAQWGRNQAILADSMASGQADFKGNMRDIRFSAYNARQNLSMERMISDNNVRTAWQSADLAADANRMLEPLKLPGVPMPSKQPRSSLQNPMRPMAPPKPIKGVNTAPGGNWGSAIGSGALGIGASVAGALAAAPAGVALGPLAIGASILGAL